MRLRWINFALLMLLGLSLEAGEVIVDSLQAVQKEGSYYALYGNDSCSPSTAVRVRKVAGVVRLYGSGVESYIEEKSWGSNCVFIQVNEGDRVSLSSFSSATSFFQRVHMFCGGTDSVETDYSIKVGSSGGFVYLAFLVNDSEGYPISIGWVSLWVSSSGVWVEASAIDTGCNDLVAGNEYWGLVVPADGGTWQDDVYVDATKTGDGWGYRWDGAWGSIQEGIRALRHQDSTIHVKPGVYGGIGLIDIPCFEPEGENHLVIESTEGPSVTFIDGGGYGVDSAGTVTGGTWCVSCGDATTFPHVTLRGFTLRNGLGGARGVKYLENCVIENCQYGLSNTFTTACTIRNVEAPLAPGAGASATIEYTPTGFQVAPALSPVPDPQSHMLLGTASLASSVWSVTTNFSDSAFMQTNRFFTIGIRREE